MKFVEDRYSCNKNQLFKEIKLRRDDDFQQVEEEVLLIKIDKANLRMMSSLLDILMDINSFTGQALLCVCCCCSYFMHAGAINFFKHFYLISTRHTLSVDFRFGSLDLWLLSYGYRF